MNRGNRMRWIFTVLLALALGGCAARKIPATQYYTIDTRTPRLEEVALRAPRFDSLEIAMVHPTRLTNSSNIFYLDAGHRQQPYSYSRWYETVDTMLENKLLLAIERANVAKTVVGKISGATTSWRLEIAVFDFIQDFTQKERSKARVSLLATLLDNRSKKVVAAKLFTKEIPSPSDDARGGVEALNEATDEVVREMIGWLSSLEC